MRALALVQVLATRSAEPRAATQGGAQVVRSGQSRALVRGACVCVLLGALASGCTTDSTTSNVSLATGTAAGPTIAFESIAGPPPGVFNRLVDELSTEAQSRNLAIASREGAANYRVRGYMAAQVIRGRTHVSWVWDVYDGDRLRALRITGEEAGGRAGGDPWSVADDPMVHKIARASMDQLTAFLSNPGAVPESAIATAPEPETPRPRRPRSAANPTAAERLAMSATR
jgi:hypothetical protein